MKTKQTSFVIEEELINQFNQKYNRLLTKFLRGCIKMAIKDTKFIYEVLINGQ